MMTDNIFMYHLVYYRHNNKNVIIKNFNGETGTYSDEELDKLIHLSKKWYGEKSVKMLTGYLDNVYIKQYLESSKDKLYINRPRFTVRDVIKIKNDKNDKFVFGYIYEITSTNCEAKYNSRKMEWYITNPKYRYGIVIQPNSYYNDIKATPIDLDTLSILPFVEETGNISRVNNLNNIIKYPRFVHLSEKVTDIKSIMEYFDNKFYNRYDVMIHNKYTNVLNKVYGRNNEK